MDRVQYLSDEYLGKCNDGLQSCQVTREFVDKCERCMLDVSDRRATNDNQEAFFRLVKEQFFPGAL